MLRPLLIDGYRRVLPGALDDCAAAEMTQATLGLGAGSISHEFS